MKQYGSNILPQTPSPTLGMGSKFNFSEHGHAVYQIKWHRECSNMQTCHFLSLHTPSAPGWGQMSKHFYSESSHFAYQIRREWSIEHDANTYSILTHTLNLWVGLKSLKNLNVVMLHIKLRGEKYRLAQEQTL